MAIGYKHNSRKVLVAIATAGGISTEPGNHYLSCFTDIYYNVSVFPVVLPHFLGSHFNACNATENNNRTSQ